MAGPTKYREASEAPQKEADQTTGDPDHQRMLRQLADMYDGPAGNLAKLRKDAGNARPDCYRTL
jgi:hypothetical protein